MKKHKTYILVCDFCGKEFTYQARDSYHIARIYCEKRECCQKRRNLNRKNRAEYYKRLNQAQKTAIPLEGKKKYTIRKKIKNVPLKKKRKLLQKIDGKIIRIENGIMLGEIVDEDEERYCVSKAGGSPVWYQKKAVCESIR